MGREIKRVALDFKWPMGEIWKGYLNPYGDEVKECKHCEGSGYSEFAMELHKKWYGASYPEAKFQPSDSDSVPFTADEIMTLRTNRVGYSNAQWQADRYNQSLQYHLTQADVDALWQKKRLWDFLPHRGAKAEDHPAPKAYVVNRWAIGSGHDSINEWVVIRARCEVAGAESKCAVCGGEGSVWSSDEAKRLSKEWEKQEPPTGKGYQVWETVTEGSPVSPVFADIDQMKHWLVNHEGYSQIAVESFAKEGWSPSGGFRIQDGVLSEFRGEIEALVDEETEDDHE